MGTETKITQADYDHILAEIAKHDRPDIGINGLVILCVLREAKRRIELIRQFSEPRT